MKLCIFAQAVDFLKDFGGRTWARTKDPLIKSQLLYQLSYASISRSGQRPGEGVAYSVWRAGRNPKDDPSLAPRYRAVRGSSVRLP